MGLYFQPYIRTPKIDNRTIAKNLRDRSRSRLKRRQWQTRYGVFYRDRVEKNTGSDRTRR
ncbi:hypothetical protein [Baaleninema simplex]|uniref:hypothetical protein n=1 Tax=Baaleninema simplex TaxID=2862350 RepID=UPI000346BFEE|nr:hypothetical protein [Baaleninema simplex]